MSITPTCLQNIISKNLVPVHANQQTTDLENWTTEKLNCLTFLFPRLFEVAPDAQDLFYNFKDLKNQDELLQSLKELDHVARVMSAFGNCIELLDDMNQFESTVQGLGKAHKKIGINVGHLGVCMVLPHCLTG